MGDRRSDGRKVLGQDHRSPVSLPRRDSLLLLTLASCILQHRTNTMALAPLLRSAAVLDLCEGDVVLPTHLPRLERHTDVENGDDLRPKLASADVDSRVVGLQAFLENPRHALESAAKTTERRKSRLSVIGRALRGTRNGGRRNERREVSPSLAAMTESLALVSGLLKRIAAAGIPGSGSITSTVYAMGEVAEALENALGLLEELPSPGEAGRVGEAERDEFYGFLEKLLLKIRDASEKPGKVLIIPCGWLRRPCSSDGRGDDKGHCVLLVLHRCRDREEFLMGIVNTGEGLQYHPASLSRLPPNPELPLRQSPLVLTGVNVDRIRSSGFWYLLYRQILYPDPANGPEAFYGLLLPFLNEKPLSANASALFPKWLEHVPIPVAGDRSGAICVERAVRFALVVAGMDAASASWWSGVGLRRALLDCMNEALQTTQLRSPAPAEFALLQVGISSLARTAAAMRGHEQQKLELQSFIESLDSRAQHLEQHRRSSRSVQPPSCAAAAATSAATGFAGFGRVLLQNVEHLKGEAKFGSLTLPSFPSALPTKIYSATEASEVCHLVRSMVTLMMNQQDRLPHAAASSFALVIHLVSRLLPMPLAVDDAQWPKACFWAGDQALTFETKRELLRNLSGLARGVSAAASALSAIHATREMDSARTCVCAAIVALMDALLRRPLELRAASRAVQERHGDLFSLHYAGKAGGPESPCRPFILSSNSFRDISKALLLPQPEMALLRAQALDYFESLERFLDKSSASQSSGGIVFNFDKGMNLTDADRLLVEQLSLSIGLDPSPQALTGERPELIDFFPELAWLRDAVFLWKVLLLPPGEEADKASRRPRLYTVPLQWRFVSNKDSKHRKSRKSKGGEDGTLAVQGFELSGKKAFSSWWATSNWQGLQSLKRWILGQDGYKSDFRSISQANPSILSGSPVDCEEDILALQSVPTFGSSLKPSESELLLTYLLAPYMRIPLILNFFWDKQRMTLLQEPQLQAILEAVLFEPGPWLSQKEALEELPKTIPADSAAYLSTRAGLLFNEMQYSPEPDQIEAAQYDTTNLLDLSLSTIPAGDAQALDGPPEIESASDLEIDPTCPFVCGYQVHCTVDGVQHVLAADGSQCLADVLNTHDMSYVCDLVAINPLGKILKMNTLIDHDMHITFHRLPAKGKTLCEQGLTWAVCKADTRRDLLGTLAFLPVAAWDIALWPMNPLFHVDQDTPFLLTLEDKREERMRLGDFSSLHRPHDEAPQWTSLDDLPNIATHPDTVQIHATHLHSSHRTKTLMHHVVAALDKALIAIDWEWKSAGPSMGLFIGNFQPRSEASTPVRVLVNVLLRSLFEIAMSFLSQAVGTHVVLKYNGLLFWCGLLDENLDLKTLGKAVHTVLTCIGDPHPSWTQGARRIHLEGKLSDCKFNSRGNINFYLCSPMSGGGGKIDTWKEAKSLLGKLLIEKGWPVKGLDDVTTKWVRAISANKIFAILKQNQGEKQWSAITEAAKWHGIQVEPDEPIRLKAIQKIQRAIRQNAPANLSATGFQLVSGYFADDNGSPVKILGLMSLQASGICLMEWEDALPWLKKGVDLVPDELAVLTLIQEKLPVDLPQPTEVTFPALDTHGRKVVLRGHLWQLGEKKIKMATHDHGIAMESSMVMAFTVWKDECKDEQWALASTSLVKFAFSCFDTPMKEATIQVWGRSFRDHKGKTAPENACSAQFHCRLLSTYVEQILKESGKGPVYATPKSENSLSHPDWGMIWLRDKIELELAASRATQHSGFARTKDRFALRVKASLIEQVAKEVRPNDPPRQNIPVSHMFKIQPLPKGLLVDQLVKWAEALKWNIRVIKKLGHDAVLVGSNTVPPHEHMTMNGSLVLIKPVSPKKSMPPKASALVAGPRQPIKSQASPGIAKASADPMGDPWANYHATQPAPRNGGLPAHASTANSTPANVARQVDAPIAAKFTALENRLAKFEAGLDEIKSEQKHYTNAITLATKQSEATAKRVGDIENNVKTMNVQMQAAVETAICKGLANQEKKLDAKFQSLLDMLSKGSSSQGSKRQTVDEEGDAPMESPVKQPAKK
eukprot:s365_g10.t1